MRSECRVLLGHCIAALCSPDFLLGQRGRSAQNLKPRNSGGKRGRKFRQKMRSECRALLGHCNCVVTTVLSPGCMCCTGGRGKQMQQRNSKTGSKRGMKMRQKLRSACRVLLVHYVQVVAIVLSSGCVCCTGVRGKQMHQRKRNKSGSKRGRKLRRKLRSACRVLLGHCVVAIVLSPGFMCCTGLRSQRKADDIVAKYQQTWQQKRDENETEADSEVCAEFCWFIALLPLCSHQVVCDAHVQESEGRKEGREGRKEHKESSSNDS